MPRLLKTLLWCTLQVAVVGLFLWLDYEGAKETGRKPEPGGTLIIGGMIAFALTMGLTALFDLPRRLRARAAAKRAVRDVGQPQGDHLRFPAPGRGLGQLSHEADRRRIG